MQCRSCGYALWGLSTSRCPECGEGFDLRDYRFTPDTVAFACPHCRHEHRGGGPQYLPASDEQMTCQGCGATIRVPEMPVVLLAPHDKTVAAYHAGDVIPWEVRLELGYLRTWWRTCRLSIVDPREMADRLSENDSESSISFIMATFGLVLLPHVLAAFFAVQLSDPQGAAYLIAAMIILGAVVIAMLAYIAMIVAVAVTCITLITHLIARAFGGRAPFAITLQCTLYSQGATLWAVVPVIGLVLLPVWQMRAWWNASTMLARRHHIGRTTALIAAAWLPGAITALWLLQAWILMS